MILIIILNFTKKIINKKRKENKRKEKKRKEKNQIMDLNYIGATPQ
jgi:hypothetical protein